MIDRSPSPASTVDRAAYLAPWIVGVFFAAPCLIAKYPPMDDLPLHEACVGLLRHWGDPVFSPKGLYFINLGHANQLFSFILLAFSYVMPIGAAAKAAVALEMLLLPLAAARFADHVHASRWTALLVAAPLGFGWLFFWGLVQNILGLIALLALLPEIDRFASAPTARRAAWMCAAMVLLHFAHEAMQLVACAALVLCSVGTSLRPKSLALRAVPLLFCLAVVYAANVYAWHVAGPRNVDTPLFTFYDMSHKVKSASGVLFGGYEPWVRNSIFALALAPVLLFAIRRPRPGHVDETFFERLHAWRFEVLGGLLVLVYLVAPANIRSTTLVYHRFLPPAWALLVVGVAARHGRSIDSFPRITPFLCAIVPLASMLVGWPCFADSNRTYTDLDALMVHMDPGSSSLTVNLGPNPPFRLWEPTAAMGYVVAERGGRSLYDYTQSPVSPVAQRPEKQWPEPINRMEHFPSEMRPAWDFTRFRYALVVTPDRGLGEAVKLALRKYARFVASRGDWYLFESRLPVVPIDAPPAPLPSHPPPTLREELEKVVKEIRAAENGTGPVPEIP